MIQSESCHHMHPFVLLFYMFFDYSLLHFIWAVFTSFGRIQKMDGITCWIESHQVDMTLGHICHYAILIFNKTKLNEKNEREKKNKTKTKRFLNRTKWTEWAAAAVQAHVCLYMYLYTNTHHLFGFRVNAKRLFDVEHWKTQCGKTKSCEWEWHANSKLNPIEV